MVRKDNEKTSAEFVLRKTMIKIMRYMMRKMRIKMLRSQQRCVFGLRRGGKL